MSAEGDGGSTGQRLSRLARNSGIYALGGVGIKLATALLAPIYTVLLAPEEYGLWGLGSMMITGLSLAFNPALHGAVTRFYFDHEHDEEQRTRFQGTMVTFLLGWSVVLVLALSLLGPMFLGQWVDGLTYWPYGVFIVATCALNTIGVVPRATWTAAEKASRLVGINGLSTAANLGVALLLVVGLRQGVIGLFAARLAAVAVVAWPFIVYIKRHVKLAFDRDMLFKALAFSLPLVPHLLAHWVLALSDRLLIERTLGVAMVGIYASSYVFIDAVNLVGTSLNSAWVPQFTRAYSDEREHPYIARTVTYFVLTLLVAALALGGLAPSIIELAFDPRYHAAAPLTPVLVAGGFLQGAYYLFVAVLFFHKRNRLVPVVTAAAACVNVALTLHWLPTMGILGAAWATLVSYGVLSGLMALAARSMGGLPMELGRLGALLAWAAVCVGGLWAVAQSFGGWSALGLTTGVLLFGAGGLWLLPIWSDDERAWLRGRARRLMRR